MHGRRKRDQPKEESSKKRKDEIPPTNTNSNVDNNDEDESEFPVMEYRHLGKSGLKVSVVSLGAWVNFGEKINEDAVVECIKMARKAGINYFDTAEIYGNGRAEIVMGRAIKRCEIKRSDLVISTKLIKCGNGPNDQGLSMKHIIEGLDASLERLQLRYVDMVYCHRPDPTTPIGTQFDSDSVLTISTEETVRAMSLVIMQGKVFYWGTSEWTSQQVMEAHSVARQYNLIPPSMEQLEYNLFRREKVEKEFTPLYKSIGLGICGWSPLAYGLLSGKYNEGIPHNSRFAMEKFKDYASRLLNSEEGKLKLEKIKKLESLAEYLECTMAQLSIAWCLKNPNISCVITGASNPNQIKENVNASRFVSKLTDAICKQIEDILGNKVVPETPPTWARYQPQEDL